MAWQIYAKARKYAHRRTFGEGWFLDSTTKYGPLSDALNAVRAQVTAYPKLHDMWEYCVKNEVGNTYIFTPDETPKALDKVKALQTTKTDLKSGVAGKKPQLSQIPRGALFWAARGFQYGGEVPYERGNYRVRTVDHLADFERYEAYIDANLRHCYRLTTEMEYARTNPEGLTKQRILTAMLTKDVESKLPELCHALCTVMMAIQQGIDCGLLPEDPGTPWRTNVG